MPLGPGVTHGPNEVLTPLGAGGMGEVYRARDPRLKREVAIKVLPGVFAHDPERLRRFEREARAAGALNHPHILAVYDTGAHEGVPYVVSELLEGETLRKRLAGALPARKAVEIAVQIARGLAAAHDKGIVHRDLKPENVFVARDGHVKILDFGLAKLTQPAAPDEASALATESATGPGTMMGTAAYMSPEQVRGEHVDHRSDIFSFGAILYEMLAGRGAFRRETSAETMAAILKEDPPEAGQVGARIPAALDRIVHHCLEKNREERFASARDLAFDLQALSETSAPSFRSPERRRRQRVWWGLVAVGWTAGVSAVSYWTARALHEPPAPSYLPLTFRHGTVTGARFSPDGTYFLYSAAWEGGRSRVFSTRLEEPGGQDLDLEGRLVGAAGGDLFVLGPDAVLSRAGLSGVGARPIADGIELADVTRDGSRIAAVRKVGLKHRLEYPLATPLHETTGRIDAIRLSPDARRVAILEAPNAGAVFTVVKIVEPGTAPRTLTSLIFGSDVGWSPDGSEIWYSAWDADASWTLYAASLDGRRRTILRTPQRPIPCDARPDGRIVLDLAGYRWEVAGLGAGADREMELSFLSGPEAYDISSDGKTVAVTGTVPGGETHSAHIVKFDGTPPIRLGQGLAIGFSPNGRYVSMLMEPGEAFTGLAVLPTGAGEGRGMPRGSVRFYTDARFMPDGQRLLIAAREEGRERRLFLQDLGGGLPRPITPEGVGSDYPLPSPDGKWVAAGGDWRKEPYRLHSLEGGEPRPIPGLDAGEQPLRFDADGTHLFLRSDAQDAPLVRIERLDLRSGRQERWKEIHPSNPAGIASIWSVYLTPDGRNHVYRLERVLSTLHLATGLR